MLLTFTGFGNLFNYPPEGDSEYDLDVTGMESVLLEIREGPNVISDGKLTWTGDPGGLLLGSHSFPGFDRESSYNIQLPVGVTTLRFKCVGIKANVNGGTAAFVNTTSTPRQGIPLPHPAPIPVIPPAVE